MVSMIVSSVVDRAFEPGRVKLKTEIVFCCFFAKHTALRRKSKDWLAQNHNNVSEWIDISNHRLLFQ